MPNKHIVLIGMPGVGKTSVGKCLSALLNLKHIDIDQQIESKESESINDIIKKRGEEVFRALEKEELKRSIQNQSISIISTGGGIIINDESRNLIKQKSHGIHLKSTIKEIAERIDASTRPLLYNTNKIEKLEGLWLKRKKLYNRVAQTALSVEGLSIKEAAQKVYQEVQSVYN